MATHPGATHSGATPAGANIGAAVGPGSGAGAQPLDATLAGVVDLLTSRRANGVSSIMATTGDRPYALDCGGGSGRRAVPLALHGAEVTVIDASIDALAILSRRAGEAGVASHVHGLQADVDDLGELVAPRSVDLVLVHDVLAGTADPAAVVSAAARAVAVGGYLSIVVPNPVSAVLARALSGEFDAALREWIAQDEQPNDRGLDLDRLRALVEAQGCEVVSTLGLNAISSMVPGSVLDGQPGAVQALAELDGRAATQSPYREIAGQLHLLAHRAD